MVEDQVELSLEALGEQLTSDFKQITDVADRVDLPNDASIKILKDIGPLTDAVASSGKLQSLEQKMFVGLGKSTDGRARGIASQQGLTLEESFFHAGAEYVRSLYWNPKRPDMLEVYSMKRHSGFGSESNTVTVPLNGDLEGLVSKAPVSEW